jgi:gas vesicle protein
VSGGSGFLGGVLIGGLVGAALGVIFAPKSGQQTRAEFAIWRAENQPTEAAASPVDDLANIAAAVIRGALERLDQAREAARRAADDTEQALVEEWQQRKLGS